jgi:phospholipase/lecithinase/hemolysin
MKPIRKNRLHSLKRTVAGSLACLTIAVGLANANADLKPFSRIYAFGDSLTDTGNFYTLSGGYPPAPYYDGRFSNGRLWIEYLADELQMEIRPGDNYAVGGATTGRDNSNNGLAGRTYPGLQDQIDAFVADHKTHEACDALFTVWTGANDFFIALQTGTPPETLISNGVFNTVVAIQRLHQAGARNILVMNLPDLGLTPYALNAGLSELITQLSAAYNQVLDASLDALAAAGIRTIRVDSFATLRSMATEPADYGFTNVTEPFLTTGGDPDQFLFLDEVHPTTRGHEVVADEALDRLIKSLLPRHGKDWPKRRGNPHHGFGRESSESHSFHHN